MHRVHSLRLLYFRGKRKIKDLVKITDYLIVLATEITEVLTISCSPTVGVMVLPSGFGALGSGVGTEIQKIN